MQQKDNIKNLVECWSSTASRAQNLMNECQAAEFWNKRSVSYAKNIKDAKNQNRTREILEFLEELGFNAKGSKVLDIGCGPGTLSLPLARMGAEVTALDISEGMLKRLRESAKEEGLSVEALKCSWWTADINEMGFSRKYDLVLASTTPGVNDVESFERMMACSKDLCYYSNFLQRGEDKAYQDIRSLILRDNQGSQWNGMIFPFMYLYLSGYNPNVRINHSLWEEETGWEEAAERAIDFIGRGREFDAEIKGKISDYYMQAAKDGMYTSRSDVYTGMMAWKVNGR